MLPGWYLLRTPKGFDSISGPRSTFQKIAEQYASTVDNPDPRYSYRFLQISTTADLNDAKNELKRLSTERDIIESKNVNFERIFPERFELARKKGWYEYPDIFEEGAFSLGMPAKNPCSLRAIGRRQKIPFKSKVYLVPTSFWDKTCVEDQPTLSEDEISELESRRVK